MWIVVYITNPKYFEDRYLEEAITAEITAYMHLRQEWGRLVPHFGYFGYDIGPVWVLVTSCEGIPLSDLAKRDGGLTEQVKENARQSLHKLHLLGVTHGKAHTQYVVYRERDGQTLWMDFTMSATFLEDVTYNDKFEEECFDDHLSKIPTIEK